MFGVLDQGFSSLTNLALNIAVATTSSIETYGALGLAIALYLLEFGVIYGAVIEPYSIASREDRERSTGDSIAAATSIGLVLTGLHVAMAGFSSGVTASLLLLFAVATPGLILQIAARGLLIASGQSSVSLRSNMLWALVQGVLSVIALATGSSSGLFLAWAAGGWAAAAYALWHLGVGVRVHGWRRWFHGRTRLALSWTGDYLAQNGTAQILVFGLGAVAGLSAVAAYRGALQFAGPATVVVGGIRQVVLPGAARRARAADGSLHRAIHRLAFLFPATTLVLVGPFLFIPASVGEAILGDTWSRARAVLPWILVMRMAMSAGTAFAVGLRATRESRTTLFVRVGGGLATLVGAVAAGAWRGAVGASAALALVSVALLPLWWRVFVRHARRYESEALHSLRIADPSESESRVRA